MTGNMVQINLREYAVPAVAVAISRQRRGTQDPLVSKRLDFGRLFRFSKRIRKKKMKFSQKNRILRNVKIFSDFIRNF